MIQKKTSHPIYAPWDSNICRTCPRNLSHSECWRKWWGGFVSFPVCVLENDPKENMGCLEYWESEALFGCFRKRGGPSSNNECFFCLKMMSQKYANHIVSYRYLDRYCNLKVPDFFQVSAAQEENRRQKPVSGFVSWKLIAISVQSYSSLHCKVGPLLSIVDVVIPPLRSISIGCYNPSYPFIRPFIAGIYNPIHIGRDPPCGGPANFGTCFRGRKFEVCVPCQLARHRSISSSYLAAKSEKKRKSSMNFAWRRATVTIHTYSWLLQRFVVSAYVYSHLEEEFHFWQIEFNWVEKPRQLHVDYPWWIRIIIHLVSQNFQKYLFCVRCFLDLGSTFIHEALHGQQM